MSRTLASASDTIVAIATPAGRGGVGVLRVSGAKARALMKALCGDECQPRKATLVRFRDAKGETIDRGLVLFFAAPHSYTGEDVLELHGHGGPQVMRGLLERCIELAARVARPGEFTERAFLNGKLDLAQAEAVADLIDANTTSAARAAVRNLEGAFSTEIHRVQARLTELRVFVEGGLDFPDEDLDALSDAEARERLDPIVRELEIIRQRAGSGRLLSEGLHIVLAGRPNVGKSSLLNRLVGRDAAIVTPIAGTTRDALREAIEIEGIPLHVTDTAGLRETGDEIERLGMERTHKALASSDLALLVGDARYGWTADDRQIEAKLDPGLNFVRILNKSDLAEEAALLPDEGKVLRVSALTGAGMEALRKRILDAAGWRGREEQALMAHGRHLAALEEALERLRAARPQIRARELFAEELRLAQEVLGRITGETSADDLLGEIFGRFCIGK